jgi:hypothetical protein
MLMLMTLNSIDKNDFSVTVNGNKITFDYNAIHGTQEKTD